MSRVTFLSSVQGFQGDRVSQIAERLRKERPDVAVEVQDPEASRASLARIKLKFGPAVLIDGRLEFVGVPRYRMLVERIAKSSARAAAPPPPAAAATVTPKPAAPGP